MRAALLVFLPILLLQQSQPQPSQNQPAQRGQEKQNSANADGNPQPPPPSLVGSQAETAIDAGENTHRKDGINDPAPWRNWVWEHVIRGTKITDWLTVAFAALLFGAAIVQIFVYRRQAQAMERGLRHSTIQTRIANKSAIAAKIAADAAALSANTSKRALEVLERADLTLLATEVRMPIDITSLIIVSIKNHGRAKARNVRVRLTLTIINESFIGSPSNMVLNEDHYPFSIGPGEDRPKGLQFGPPSMSAEMTAKVTNGMVRMVANVAFSYEDGFASYAWMGEGFLNPSSGSFVITGT